MYEYLPFLPINCVVQYWLQLPISQATPFPDKAYETRIMRLEERKVVDPEGRLGRFLFRTVRSQLAGFNMSPVCLGALRVWMCVRRAMALIGDAIDNVSPSEPQGKSGPVETGLTGPAATALN